MLEIAKLVDAAIKNSLAIRAVLLVLLFALAISSGYYVLSAKALRVQRDLCRGSVAEYAAAAELADAQRKELEQRVIVASEEIARTRRDYEVRIEKLRRSKITATTCDAMVAESVQLLQGVKP